MRHKVTKYRLSLSNRNRDSLIINLAISLINSNSEFITTTITKAKAMKPFVEKLITLGKKGGLSDRRRIISLLNGNILSSKISSKLIDDLGQKYKERNGGYTRVIRNGFRQGDNAEMAIIQFV